MRIKFPFTKDYTTTYDHIKKNRKEHTMAIVFMSVVLSLLLWNIIDQIIQIHH